MLRGICEVWLREFLHVYYGTLQILKQVLRDRTPKLFKWLKSRRRYFVGRERAALFSQLAADGASVEYLASFRAELTAVDFSRLYTPGPQGYTDYPALTAA